MRIWNFLYQGARGAILMTGKMIYSGYQQAPRFFINGVWGGPLSQGHIVAHFLFKHVTPPESSEFDNTGKTTNQEGVLDVNEVMVTLVIPPEEAKSIGEWMIRHAESIIEGGAPPNVPLQ
jgi:hypothetical protein